MSQSKGDAFAPVVSARPPGFTATSALGSAASCPDQSRGRVMDRANDPFWSRQTARERCRMRPHTVLIWGM